MHKKFPRTPGKDMPTNMSTVSSNANAGSWRDTRVFEMTDLDVIIICTVTALVIAIGLAVLLPLPNDASDLWEQITSSATYWVA
jgi:hypothetical protein